MIPVQGYQGRKVAVLGLGRSGLATARALVAGGAEPLLWDDSPESRAKAEAEGFAMTDLTRHGALEGVAVLVVSPGIPHLYPAPHKVIARAMEAGVPVDNDIGLFFRSYATKDWDGFDQVPRVVAVTGSNGKSTTTALIRHILDEAGRPVQMAGNIGRGVLDIDPATDGEVVVLELSSYQIELARSHTLIGRLHAQGLSVLLVEIPLGIALALAMPAQGWKSSAVLVTTAARLTVSKVTRRATSGETSAARRSTARWQAYS